LKRAIQQYLQDPLALALLQGQFQWGDRIVAKLEGDRIVFVPEAGSEAGAG
jgi:ATP-dependent Clp protease ATP-binding subunit ClpB